MGYGDDEDSDVTAQAFAGLKGHVDGYKHYMNKLKKGAKSGISQSFGNAADLLPPEHLTQYRKIDTPLGVGQSLFSEKTDSAVLRQAVEQMVLMANSEVTGANDQASRRREIIGVFVEDGKKMHMYDDYSVEPAAEPSQVVAPVPAAASPVPYNALVNMPFAAPVQAPNPLPERASAYAAPGAITSSASYSGPSPLPPPAPPQPVTAAPAFSEPASAAAGVNQSPVATQSSQPSSMSESSLRVSTALGVLLWDVTMDGGDVALILLADQTVIQKADGNKYVVTGAVKPGQRVPQVEIVADVVVDPSTGNIYYQNLAGNQAVALLNNGWRIDQFKHDGSDDQYFVTEPLREGQAVQNRQQVSSLTVDSESGAISYDTADGGASMTLRCHKLN